MILAVFVVCLSACSSLPTQDVGETKDSALSPKFEKLLTDVGTAGSPFSSPVFDEQTTELGLGTKMINDSTVCVYRGSVSVSLAQVGDTDQVSVVGHASPQCTDPTEKPRFVLATKTSSAGRYTVVDAVSDSPRTQAAIDALRGS